MFVTVFFKHLFLQLIAFESFTDKQKLPEQLPCLKMDRFYLFNNGYLSDKNFLGAVDNLGKY
jgi:hypothetical protein